MRPVSTASTSPGGTRALPTNKAPSATAITRSPSPPSTTARRAPAAGGGRRARRRRGPALSSPLRPIEGLGVDHPRQPLEAVDDARPVPVRQVAVDRVEPPGRDGRHLGEALPLVAHQRALLRGVARQAG